MTRDDIIRMAKNEYDIYAFTAESLKHLLTLAIEAEREGCAREVYKVLRTIQVADQAATAIRARGNK